MDLVVDAQAGLDPHAALRRQLEAAADKRHDGQPLLRRLVAGSEPGPLRALLQDAPPLSAPVRQAVRARLRSLVGEGDAPDLLVALYHTELQRQNEAVARLIQAEEHAALAEIAVESEDSGIRLKAAEHIADPPLLVAVLERVARRDRHVVRAVRAQLERQAAEGRHQQEREQEREQCCGALEALAEAPWHSSYRHRLLHQLRKWAPLADGASDALGQRVAQAQQCCEERVEAYRRKVELPLELQGCCETLEEALAPLRVDSDPKAPDTVAAPPPSTAVLHRTLQEQQACWSAAVASVTPDEALGQRWHDLGDQVNAFFVATKSLAANQNQLELAVEEPVADASLEAAGQRSQRLEEILQTIEWPHAFAEPPPVANLRGALKSQRQCQQRLKREERALESSITAAAGRLQALLRRGHTRQASALLRRIEHERLPQLSAAARQRSVQALEDAKKRLVDLCGWRDFAARPKYLALCEAMERLAQESMHPKAKAGRVKALQLQWQALGRVGDESLWQRFRTLADRAFKPCAEFFARDQVWREQNLERRQKLCGRLAAQLERLDPERPEWRETMSVLRQVGTEWQRTGAVPRAQQAAVEKRYQKLCAAIERRVEPARLALHQQRQKLIEQAQCLEGPADAQKAQLMQQHFMTLEGSDNPQQAQAFQDAMDAFFGTVSDDRVRRGQERKVRQGKLSELIAALRSLEPLAAEEQYQQLSQEADELLSQAADAGDNPATLRREYGEARERHLERRQQQLAKRRTQTESDELTRRATLCLRLEGAKKTQRKTLGRQLASEWSSGTDLSPGLHSAMQRRWDAALAGTAGASAQERRLACIRAELLANLASPAEDSELRTTYQLQHMQEQGFKGQQINLRQVQALRLEWLGGPVSDTATEQALAGRFSAAVEAMEGQLRVTQAKRRKTLAAVEKRTGAPARQKARRPRRRPRS